ncbi:MAG TPA: hypothetical protein VKK81_06985 [Candidatus Binatia bacterium]|nr:hypothetical protein [Candidatus Binatia bacterium]
MLPPGEPVPKDLSCDIARAENRRVHWSVTVLTTAGRPQVETFEAATNGKSSPISNNTTVSFRPTDDTLEATFAGPAGQSDSQTRTLSADQEQMTCRGILTEGDGLTVHYVDVYDRR